MDSILKNVYIVQHVEESLKVQEVYEMIIIELKKIKDCNNNEIKTGSYYNTVNKHLVVIEDHPFVKERLPYVIAHELAHYYYYTPKWIANCPGISYLFYFLEEIKITFLGGWKKYIIS